MTQESRFPGAWVGAIEQGAPEIHEEAWVAPGAVVVGRVRLGRATNVWYGSVLRAEGDVIDIGETCNLQDQVCMHVDPGFPVVLEDRVSLGHRAMVHGSYLETGCLIGIGAIVLNGARVGAGSLIAAGAVVTPGMKVPAGVLVAGVPGKVVRELTDRDRESFAKTPENYAGRIATHRAAVWE